jgi:squalene monooxygenase
LEGIDATPVEGYCVISGDRQVGIPYPELERMIKENGEWDGDVREGKGKGKANEGASGLANGQANGCDTSTASSWHVSSLSGKKEGRSFHHGRLISSLRRACLSAGPNLVVLESTVRELVYCEHTNRVIGVSAAFRTASPPSRPVDSEEQAAIANANFNAEAADVQTVVRKIYAPIVIVADGCFSKFRTVKGARIPTPRTRSHFVGVVLKDAPLPMKRHGTVCLTPSGPVLLYQIGDKAEETRMLVDVKGKLPSVADGSLKVSTPFHHSHFIIRDCPMTELNSQNHIIERYLPHLPSTLHSSILESLSHQRLRTMPNSFLPPSMQGLSSPSGLIMVGDAWNMRHPLTGGGMTVAFNDAVLLTEYLGTARLGEGREGLGDWERVSEGLREWFWKRKNLAGVVNVLSMALYDLFGGADGESRPRSCANWSLTRTEPDLEILREGCFRYFELGGECIAGPVGFLSA